MKFTSPLTILLDALQDKAPDSTTCFIDETEVALKECGVPVEEKTEDPKLDFHQSDHVISDVSIIDDITGSTVAKQKYNSTMILSLQL